MEMFYEDYPDVHKYSRAQVYNYLGSDKGKEDTKRIRTESEVKALEEGLSQKANRVMVVAEVGMKIYAKLIHMNADDKQYIPLSREMRECIKDIRVEMEGEGSSIGDATEAAINFFTHITGEGSPEWIRKAVSPSLPTSN